MPGKVISMDVRLAAAVLGAVREGEVSAFCREHSISRQTFYKYRRRFKAEGQVGLEPRSRRPKQSPTKTPDEIEERIVRIRKELDDDGLDHGPWSIRLLLAHQVKPEPVPSEATIWRILARRGLIAPEPRKRPKVSLRRFVFPHPNDCWQIDATHWHLADGTQVEIVDILDDHSRVCAAADAVASCTSQGAWDTFTKAGSVWGIPARVLSDNGLTFNGSRRKLTVTFEANLRAAGVSPIVSTPGHPQTCGKIERFHQTLKKWLTKQPAAHTLAELQAQLDTFVDYYNHVRPHRALHGKTPAAVWAATPRAVPAGHPITTSTTIARNVIVSPNGHVRIDNYQVNVGVEYAGLTVTALIAGIDCVIFWDNQLVRALRIDPTRFNQPSGRKTGPDKGGKPRPRLKDSTT
jgi:transposase InsO family protein